MTEIELLKRDNNLLRERLLHIERELEFLKTHPAIAQGLKGERLIAQLTGGTLTAFAESHDVTLSNSVSIEVKYSKLNIPVQGTKTRRWNWSKPFGWKDKGKDFDLLLLIGEKDMRYQNQYLDNSPYVYFLIPHNCVPDILTSGKAIGSNVQLTTNLAHANSPTSQAIKKHMVPAETISSLSFNKG